MTISKIKVGSTEHDLKAASADKLNTNAGSTIQPIYFANGIPKSCTYALNKSVPSNAQFTDTTYTFSTGDTNGSIKITPSSGGGVVNVPVKGLNTAAYTNSADYLTKTSPTGTGSLSLNRKADTTVGSNSVAIGSLTTASGKSSHAEGYGTTASGYASHAEGIDSTASGQASHAEGFETTASAPFSHAEGYNTIASLQGQHVQGRWNIVDSAGTYAFIIGNGTSDTDRSNAMTVDWEGDVRANHFIVPNGYSVRGVSTTGKEHGLISISTSDNIMVGSYSESGHPGNTYINAYYGDVYLRNKTASIRFESYTTSNINGVFRPVTDTKCSIGRADYRWYRLWAASSAVQTSDEREKSDIMSLSDYPATYSRNGSGNIFEQLYDKLVPKTYTLNIEGNEDVHIGFVAQDIAASMAELGLSEDDLGLIDHSYWTDEETGEEKDRYGLCYEEFAALNTYMVQKLKKRVFEQDEKIAELESKFTELESKFIELKQ